MSAIVLEDTMLDDSDNVRLRDLLRRIRVDFSITYKTISHSVECSVDELYGITGRRTKGTTRILSSVINFCRDKNISTEPNQSSKGINSILAELEIDKNIIEYSKYFIGNYILISVIDVGLVGISWVELASCSTVMPMPSFVLHRPTGGGPLRVNGVYYHYEDTLFLLGHKARTPLFRFIATTPIFNNPNLRSGFMSGASSSETLFQSYCVMKKLPATALKEEFEHALGERELEFVAREFPEEHDIILSKVKHHFSCRRSLG